MESELFRPSPPGGTPGTGGPGRAGTAAAEAQLLGWAGGVEGDVERGEEDVTAGSGSGPGFGSGTQRHGSETPEDGSGTETPGCRRSEMQSGFLRYLAKNLEFVLKLAEPRGREQRDASQRTRRVDWGSGAERREAGWSGGGSPAQRPERERWGR